MAFLSSFGFTASRNQVITYFLCVCLFSISFLVFLNSSISFVITDRIGRRKDVGDAVGTLGFADELVALVACPLWGILSDRIGVRAVAVTGYAIVALSLLCVVWSRNVYPELLLSRLFFAVGGAATSTMVTAILPTVTYQVESDKSARNGSGATQSSRDATPSSIASESTITPTRVAHAPAKDRNVDHYTASSRIAGFVGMFTGFGALVALFVFLPLPAHLQSQGYTRSTSVALAFIIVAVVALLVAVLSLIGLANLPGEEHKSIQELSMLFRRRSDDDSGDAHLPYGKLALQAIKLGFQDVNIGLAYVGGFVARASSVAISLFIPLFVNAYFISSGRCATGPGSGPHDPSTIKEECRKAYIVASKLTGVSQLIALLCAPLFGYLGARYRRTNAPLLLAAAAGVAGNAAFGTLKSPDPAVGGSAGVYLLVTLIGIGQIGAIVCSLGLLTRGLHPEQQTSTPAVDDSAAGEDSESAPLLSQSNSDGVKSSSRAHLKGSVAGIYSLAGGAGILLLTKVGGALFDSVDPGTPFFIMSAFNGVLLVVGVGCAVRNFTR